MPLNRIGARFARNESPLYIVRITYWFSTLRSTKKECTVLCGTIRCSGRERERERERTGRKKKEIKMISLTPYNNTVSVSVSLSVSPSPSLPSLSPSLPLSLPLSLSLSSHLRYLPSIKALLTAWIALVASSSL